MRAVAAVLKENVNMNTQPIPNDLDGSDTGGIHNPRATPYRMRRHLAPLRLPRRVGETRGYTAADRH